MADEKMIIIAETGRGVIRWRRYLPPTIVRQKDEMITIQQFSTIRRKLKNEYAFRGTEVKRIRTENSFSPVRVFAAILCAILGALFIIFSGSEEIFRDSGSTRVWYGIIALLLVAYHLYIGHNHVISVFTDRETIRIPTWYPQDAKKLQKLVSCAVNVRVTAAAFGTEESEITENPED